MTIGTLTMLSLTGSVVLLKLAMMAFVLSLLAKTLFSPRTIANIAGNGALDDTKKFDPLSCRRKSGQ